MPLRGGGGSADPNLVKVVTSLSNRALYFSRSPIPFDRDGVAPSNFRRHIGLYAYRREFLPRYLELAATPLETSERLEQLRLLEHGVPIAVASVDRAASGIDTPEQYDAFVRRRAASRIDD